MFLTATLCAKKAKSKHILVVMKSLVSGHSINRVRERLGDKLELISYDPFVGAEVLYRERKKLRSVKNWVDKRAASMIR